MRKRSVGMPNELADSLPVALCATDAEGRIIAVNEALAALLGHRPVIGVDGWEALGLRHPDGQAMRWEESAAARALATGAPADLAALAARPDGRRLRLRVRAAPLRDGAGAVEVLLETEALDDRQPADDITTARLAAIVASSEDAIISKTLAGVVTSWNASATRIFGYEPEEMIGQPITRIIPPALRTEEEAILARLRRGERVEHFDTERVGKDGRRVLVSLTVSPIRNRAGEVVGASKVARDITERKRAEEMQQLLLGELNHRVKNTLAIIQAIARQSLRVEPSPSAFVASFTGRLQALARAHDILVRGERQRAGLGDLVREQVDLGPHDPRIAWSGPQVVLESRSALQLALVLHELATNARKYGALAKPAGRLAIAWRVERRQDGPPELLIEWRESGTGRREPAATPGFGTLLIERSLRSDGGRAEIRRLPEGLACEIRLPLPEDAVANGSERSPDAAPAGAAGSLALSGLRILVVEDEPIIAMDIEEQLLAAGGTVIGPATDPATARQLIAEVLPDAVLLDANLAGARVDELAVELRRRRIPFAFATGFGR
ncbi:PAS domain S-box protein, partial [Amaricoccus sp.]|uniref:PAS domain S-box protein n=1 Tax=Amaricoccus sp. TaxID=1872485 RepID=UPI002608CEFE